MSTTNNQDSPPGQVTANGQQQQAPTPTSAPIPPQQAQPINSVGENLQCQWQNCGERCPSAEALYEHVCERHVGRKSTNNLNLTCQWGSCRTTTVKRDHITSHIRVHVPLKPHKCDFCGKAFKRPQDLKKHVKTHADDSMMTSRSPDMGAGPRPPNSHYNIDQSKGGAYYPAHMQGHDYGGHGQSQYYQPQQTHPSQYGGVYYPIAAGNQASAEPTYESRKRGYDALSTFFNEIRTNRFNPRDYDNFSHRLNQLQALQLPEIIPAQVPAYQPVSAIGGGYGSHNASDPIQAYSLPPMGNVKSRGELTSIDQLLQQMQSTIYESESQISAAGTGQPGSEYISYRTSDSHSPVGIHSASTHGMHQPSMLSRAHNNSISSTADSIHSSTPGLTPPSSAQSYTSGQSPLPHHQNLVTSDAMYPSLPATSGMDFGINTSAAGAPASTLGSVFDNDDRRRYSGGTLQRARPAPRRGSGDAMDMSSEGSTTPPAITRGGKKPSPTSNVIDPNLEGPPMSTSSATPSTSAAKTSPSTPHAPGDDSLKSPTSTASATAAEEVKEQKYNAWLENMRLIEYLRELVKRMKEEWPEQREDVEMGDGGEAEGSAEAQLREAAAKAAEQGMEAAGGVSYPSLKEVA
ncbi:MAG: hypothetical protein Q9227_003769 [Pyrenula ochraceoflavens]